MLANKTCCQYSLLHWPTKTVTNQKKIGATTDELIVEKDRYADVNEDLDFTLVDLIEGVDPQYTARRPKPPTPPPRPPSPPKPTAEELAAIEAAKKAEEDAAAAAEAAAAGGAEKSVPKEASPFDLQKHLPPEAAEVPFVKSHEDPKPKTPEPAPAPAPSPSPAPEVAPEAAPAPAEGGDAPPAEAPPAEAPAEAPPAPAE